MSVPEDFAGIEGAPSDAPPEALLPPDAEPAAPKRGRPKGSKTRKHRKTTTAAARAPRPLSRKAAVKAMLSSVGQVWHFTEMARGHEAFSEDYPTCGSVLLAQADDIAGSLSALAQQDASVARWLDAMMTGGGWGGVILATWPVAQSILQAHVMPGLARRREQVEVPESEQAWSGPEPTIP
jgi:hypothetical protein